MFKMLIYNKSSVIQEVDITELLNLGDSNSMINGIQEPFINACFIDSNKVFVNLLNKATQTNYHFAYDVAKQSIIVQPVAMVLDWQSSLNFPIKMFFNKESDMIHIFYRQGQMISVYMEDYNKVK